MARFTVENAAEMAAKAHESRRQRKLALLSPPPLPQAGDGVAGDNLERRLACVREQIDLLEIRLIQALKDPKSLAIDIDRLSKSLSAMREDERRYLGRSLPPTIKALPQKRERERVPMCEPT